MGKVGKACLLISALAFVGLMATRTIIGGWIDVLYIPLALFVIGLVAAAVLEYRVILEFFTMRTTKHGMNMGALILLSFVLIFSINYLGVRFNKSFDITEEKLNSLSDQSVTALKGLEDDLTFVILYKGEEANDQKLALKQSFQLYEDANPKVKVKTVNTYVDNVAAQQYLGDVADRNQGQAFVFVEYKGRKVRIDPEGPGQLGEEKITAALIRATRKDSKVIYFVSGHGERELRGEDPEALTQLVETLEGASFKVESLNFAQAPSIPENASLVALVGTTSPLLDAELEILRKYARSGGRLLIAADPGQRHNLALLTKPFGVEYRNNFILNEISQIVGRGLASAIGLVYDKNSEITKKFRDGEMTIFDLASEVVPTAEPNTKLKLSPLVTSHETAFAVSDLSKAQKPNQGDLRVQTLAVLSEGEIEGAGEKSEFAAVVFGDSDFMANKSFFQGLNRDLALNAFSYLIKEGDLISIRPKQPKGTQMMLTEYSQLGLVGAGVGLPMALLVTSGIVWFRRRGA